MKKRILLAIMVLLAIGLLASCGNPQSLKGTKWENTVRGGGTGWAFTTATDAEFYLIVDGKKSDITTAYTYEYDGTNVTLYSELFGDKYLFAKGTVDGNEMTIMSTTYKKK